ncbi:MAG: aminotransferase class V-fold PLP-dependent enzyme [Alphaproteobacteria bacterium]|nr:MAG: aminotransferase class V-fold PLP-dependent enzyme [Alphaproteobacteria bacterium]
MTPEQSPITESELATLRADTPGAKARLHLDNCGASLMPVPVITTMQAQLQREIALGGYVAQEQQSDAHAAVYGSLAKLLGGTVEDYALTSSAVDAWSKAFYSVDFAPGDNLVTAFNEYCSNYVAFLQVAKNRGVDIRVARAGTDGALDVAHLESLVDGRTKLIAIAQVPSSSGQVNPVADVGRIARAHDVLYLLDACQAVGQLPVNVDEIGCDMLTGTSRKFLRGPRGVGILYMNARARARLEPVMLSNQAAAWVAADRYELRTDTRVHEDWERSMVNELGFGAAIDYLLAIGPARAFARTQALAASLREKLALVQGVVPTCPADATAAIITFNKAGLKAADIKARLHAEGVGVQIASVVHTRLDLEARGIDSTVRVSPNYYNSEAELERFLALIDGLK